jgi:hypothetical protein
MTESGLLSMGQRSTLDRRWKVEDREIEDGRWRMEDRRWNKDDEI